MFIRSQRQREIKCSKLNKFMLSASVVYYYIDVSAQKITLLSFAMWLLGNKQIQKIKKNQCDGNAILNPDSQISKGNKFHSNFLFQVRHYSQIQMMFYGNLPKYFLNCQYFFNSMSKRFPVLTSHGSNQRQFEQQNVSFGKLAINFSNQEFGGNEMLL